MPIPVSHHNYLLQNYLFLTMVLMCSHLKTPSKVNIFLFNFSDTKYINNKLKIIKKIHKMLRETLNI